MSVVCQCSNCEVHGCMADAGARLRNSPGSQLVSGCVTDKNSPSSLKWKVCHQSRERKWRIGKVNTMFYLLKCVF